LTLLVGQIGICQNKKAIAQDSNNFYLYYVKVGLGSNVGKFYPTVRVYNNQFTYTKEQNSYLGKHSKKVE
jgi:hypothetical protein